ncbi:hypothetical protein R5R35_014048 [Gryllus longicercus]|uniref:Uncharacterized protein n=1 Tax=Gryllus longicercus TaxID=2509291 RepID=A0AAN9ZCX6_9ORTH
MPTQLNPLRSELFRLKCLRQPSGMSRKVKRRVQQNLEETRRKPSVQSSLPPAVALEAVAHLTLAAQVWGTLHVTLADALQAHEQWEQAKESNPLPGE